MILIQKWLDGKQEFLTGRVLYNQYGKDEALKALFARGKTPEAMVKLRDALQALVNPPTPGKLLATDVQAQAETFNSVSPAHSSANPKQPQAAAPSRPPEPAPPPPIGEASDVPETETTFKTMAPAPDDLVLQAIYTDWHTKYLRMNYLRHAMDECEGDNSPEAIAACKPMCFEILALEQQVNALWDKRDYYKANGRLPEEQPEDAFVLPTDAFELGSLHERLKRYVRRYKQNCAEEPGNALYASLLAKYTNQLNQVKNAKKKN